MARIYRLRLVPSISALSTQTRSSKYAKPIDRHTKFDQQSIVQSHHTLYKETIRAKELDLPNHLTVEPTETVELGPRSTAKTRLVIALTVLGLALAYFLFTAFQSAQIYYYTVGEIVTDKPQAELVRVNGKLVSDSFSRITGETEARFELTDGATNLVMIYDGIIPDLFFNPHSEIVAEGQYHEEGIFHVDDILVKCPSKYTGNPAENT